MCTFYRIVDQIFINFWDSDIRNHNNKVCRKHLLNIYSVSIFFLETVSPAEKGKIRTWMFRSTFSGRKSRVIGLPSPYREFIRMTYIHIQDRWSRTFLYSWKNERNSSISTLNETPRVFLEHQNFSRAEVSMIYFVRVRHL